MRLVHRARIGHAARLRSSSMPTEANISRSSVVSRWLEKVWRDHPLIVVAAAIVAVLAAAVALIWPVTDLIASHDVGLITGPKRATALQSAREAVRTQLLTLGAGVFAAGALIFTARNFTLSRRTVELTRKTFELTEQGQVTDRYTKAIEQLGSDTIDVTIGGIYALERIARDSPRDQPTVMEVLAACIREHSPEQWPPISDDDRSAEPPERTTRPDVQAAITVIARRNRSHDRGHINLVKANLTRANLGGGDLTGADLSQAVLADAVLTGADLNEAHAYLANFSGASMNGVDLTDALLPGAKMRYAELVGANMTGADLTGVDLTWANLTDVVFTGTVLDDADLSDAEFSEGAAVPDGWTRHSDSGQLQRISEEPGEVSSTDK
jgi:Pentapeptide repeats (8 copies)